VNVAFVAGREKAADVKIVGVVMASRDLAPNTGSKRAHPAHEGAFIAELLHFGRVLVAERQANCGG